jgi:hypothetical protein
MGSRFDYAGATPVAVQRISDEPIVAADSVAGYGPIFNAGVIHHDGRFNLFARGVRAGYRCNDGPGDRFLDYISDVLVFTSSDGSRYEFQQVLAAGSPGAVSSYEDPRVQRVSSGGSERVFISRERANRKSVRCEPRPVAGSSLSTSVPRVPGDPKQPKRVARSSVRLEHPRVRLPLARTTVDDVSDCAEVI